MHGLAHYAGRLGLAPKEQPTRKFAKLFWKNLTKTGRVNELKLGLSLYFMNGLSEGVKTSLKMKNIGLGMVKTKRMNPMEILGGHSCKDAKGLQAILDKAREIELAKAQKFEG
jgi:quinone-modifying oxidoreductase subunit QmoC